MNNKGKNLIYSYRYLTKRYSFMDKISMFSREQENKKVFIQLGRKFNLPLDILILVYNSLRKSIDYDRSLQINFHKNILSAHLCGPPYTIFDIDDKFFSIQNPFQYRLPIGKGNEWLIYSDFAGKDNLFYHGLYNELKSRDIICQQIQIYGEINFILKYRSWCAYTRREYYDSLKGMERIRFIDRIGIDLFDHYFEYLENPQFNIVRMGHSYDELWFDDIPEQ
tara:strand:+ start:1305 stop:1973 length:669 start_codon:yes stop_codon:yes gene_type:complete